MLPELSVSFVELDAMRLALRDARAPWSRLGAAACAEARIDRARGRSLMGCGAPV